MIHLESHSEGVILPVRALPGASKSSIRGEQDGALKVSVTQIAEKGKANKALMEVLVKLCEALLRGPLEPNATVRP